MVSSSGSHRWFARKSSDCGETRQYIASFKRKRKHLRIGDRVEFGRRYVNWSFVLLIARLKIGGFCFCNLLGLPCSRIRWSYSRFTSISFVLISVYLCFLLGFVTTDLADHVRIGWFRIPLRTLWWIKDDGLWWVYAGFLTLLYFAIK